jgi:hypothetical protein
MCRSECGAVSLGYRHRHRQALGDLGRGSALASLELADGGGRASGTST